MDLTKYKESQKTAYLVVEFERLLQEESEIRALEGELGDLAKDDIARVLLQKKQLLAQMDEILEGDKEEEEFPNEIVLEIRAGVGGEEAALFAEELSHMYQAYATTQGWNVRNFLNQNQTSVAIKKLCSRSAAKMSIASYVLRLAYIVSSVSPQPRSRAVSIPQQPL
jgi:protein subunit release factor A